MSGAGSISPDRAEVGTRAWLEAQMVQSRHNLTRAEQAYAEALHARDQLVRTLRAEGFTQDQTATLLGISNQRVSQIERSTLRRCPT